MTAPGPSATPPAWCVLGHGEGGRTRLTSLGADGGVLGQEETDPASLPALVGRWEAEHSPRWVWSDAASWYPRLLAAGVTLERCHDLRLIHRILFGIFQSGIHRLGNALFKKHGIPHVGQRSGNAPGTSQGQ